MRAHQPLKGRVAWKSIFLERREVFVAVMLDPRRDKKNGNAAHGTKRRPRYRKGFRCAFADREGGCGCLVSTKIQNRCRAYTHGCLLPRLPNSWRHRRQSRSASGQSTSVPGTASLTSWTHRGAGCLATPSATMSRPPSQTTLMAQYRYSRAMTRAPQRLGRSSTFGHTRITTRGPRRCRSG